MNNLIYFLKKPSVKNFIYNYLPNKYDKKEILILSDIDDTLIPSTYKTNESIFKGMKELYNVLSTLPIFFITARTIDEKDSIIQIKKDFFLNRDIICCYGDKVDIKDIRKKYMHYAKVKFNQFEKITRCFPELEFIFFGDNLQGDGLAGYEMILHNRNTYCFIHKITNNPIIKMLKTDKLIYYSNVLDLIKKLHYLNFIKL